MLLVFVWFSIFFLFLLNMLWFIWFPWFSLVFYGVLVCFVFLVFLRKLFMFVAFFLADI